MNNSLIWCVVISGVISALSATAEDEVNKLRSEEFNILSEEFKLLSEEFKILSKTLDDKDQKIHSLEEQVTSLSSRKLEDKDKRMPSLEDQVTSLSSRLQEKEDKMRNFEERLAAFDNTTTNNAGFIVTATKSDHEYIPTGVITFDDKVIDPSNAFDIQDGKFTVPSSGNYLFFFNSFAYNTGQSLVKVYVNGIDGYHFEETNGDSGLYHQHNFMFASQLEENDELWLSNYYSDTLQNDALRPMTFVGYKTN